jgi:hypothetical protein
MQETAINSIQQTHYKRPEVRETFAPRAVNPDEALKNFRRAVRSLRKQFRL